MTITELLDLRGQYVEAGQIPLEDFKKLLVLCDYNKTEWEMAISAYLNGEAQYIL